MEGPTTVITRPNPDPTTLTTEQLHHEIEWVKDHVDHHIANEESRLKERKELFLQLLKTGDDLMNERINGVLREMELTGQSAAQAIAKSESGYEKRFENVNEFRGLVTDLIAKNVTVVEYRTSHKALEDRINGLVDRFNLTDGKGRGSESTKNEVRSNVVAAVGIMVGLASLFLFLSGLSNKVDRNTYGRIEQTEKVK